MATSTSVVSLKSSAEDIAKSLSAVAPIDAAVAQRLAAWTEILDKWSRAQRLVGWRTGKDVREEGLADSWAGTTLAAEVADAPLVDVGSGAGLPGLVLAAAWPDRPVHLVDVQRKRASFLKEAARKMGLDHVEVHHGAIEDLKGTLPAGALLVARGLSAPAQIVALGEMLSSSSVLVARTSWQRIDPWPPPGWRLAGERNSPVRGHVHQLLRRD